MPITTARGTHPSRHQVVSAAKPPGLKMENLRLGAFTRIDSPVVSRVTAHRDEALSNERSVTELPVSSGRETKPTSTAACPTEKPSSLALLAEAVVEATAAQATSAAAEEVEVEGDEVGADDAQCHGHWPRCGCCPYSGPASTRGLPVVARCPGLRSGWYWVQAWTRA